MSGYTANANRYDEVPYRRAGASGLRLPPISLGLWQNFGDPTSPEARDIVLRAFDRGVTHFDLANNYGPPPGSTEQWFGATLRNDLAPHRDELIISTKAGYLMWPGPYGEWGSRKALLASLDQSLGRLGLDYVDIFYSHRFDPDTPLEETMGALDTAVRSGRALYAGISSYGPEPTRRALAILKELGTPCVVHQVSYSMLNRWIEDELLDILGDADVGCVGFSPLAQGLLTSKYLDGVPPQSRASSPGPLRPEFLSEENLERVRSLNAIAKRRGQTLAQLGVQWTLRDPRVATVITGARTVAQLDDTLDAVDAADLSTAELAEIDQFAVEGRVNLWSNSSEAR
ncbi:MAG: aldo/keto reductase [Acidimicrobiaceae bacterium]|nr:aldo/keto reductase [Acidimicrobiaceae bacterium]MBJ32308.1 aldo/keto reductase [Acidimicrobiaceae bacterium]